MSYKLITADELARIMLDPTTPTNQFIVIDARDDDFLGGNIVGAVRDPSEQRTEQSTIG